MQYLVGTDEAGYGPNFGPLVVTATVWQLPSALPCNARGEPRPAAEQGVARPLGADLYNVLQPVVSPLVSRGDDRIVIADSKTLYKPRGSLARLEFAIFAMLQAAGLAMPRHWTSIWPLLDPSSAPRMAELPWYQDYDERLPIDADIGQIDQQAERIADGFQITQVRLLRVVSRVLCANDFNAMLQRHQKKSNCLSQVTLRLVERALEDLPPAAARIECDKHGGRNRYAALLQDCCPDDWVHTVSESRQQSVYRSGSPNCPREFVFSAGGESALPTALASMFSKYLRELAMRAFNAYWEARVDKLAPTAGYPVDARRFQREIATTQAALGIDDHQLWRNK